MTFGTSFVWVVCATFYCVASSLVLADATTNTNDIDLCDQFAFFNATDVPYAFNNNAWGNDSTGYQCLSVHDGGKAFSVKYLWTGEPSLVKGYPYMKYNPSNLPVQLWNVSKLQITGNWETYVTGKENASAQEQAQAFEDINLLSNVAIDMFLSDNKTASTMDGALMEIMIWPWYMPGVLPLGHAESTPDIDVVVIDGTPFSLYHGFNDKKQNVFSWLAHVNLTKTDADYSPLLKYIWQKGYLSGALWLGQLELGTEIKHAAAETHFEASNYTLKIVRQGDPDDDTATTTTSTTSTPTSSPVRTSTVAAQSVTTSLPSPSPTNMAAPKIASAMFPSLMLLSVIFTGGYVLG